MIIIVCGVSGTGKSTIGKLVADSLNLPFYDGDDFHPDCNVKKMTQGSALTDEDRAPWLTLLSNKLALWEKQKGAVLACSSLKEAYRKTLSAKCQCAINWVFLNGTKELLKNRLNSRKGHYFNPALLSSQLETLELPDYGLVLDITLTPQEIVSKILNQVK